jgi:hypothetical protein
MKQLNLRGLNRQARAAQKGETFIPGCTGKAGYPTRDAALEMARRRRDASGDRVTHYKCKTCGRWHLTSHPPKKRKKQIKKS